MCKKFFGEQGRYCSSFLLYYTRVSSTSHFQKIVRCKEWCLHRTYLLLLAPTCTVSSEAGSQLHLGSATSSKNCRLFRPVARQAPHFGDNPSIGPRYVRVRPHSVLAHN